MIHAIISPDTYIIYHIQIYHLIHISYVTCYYITCYIYHIWYAGISHATYTICDMPPYHITHVLLRSHVLACIPYWQVWPHVLVHMPEQPFDISFHTMQVGIENKYHQDQLDKKLSIKIYRYDVRRIHTDYMIN